MREKSIDGKMINNAIGFCHYEAHKGALNKELAYKHKCIAKKCKYLEKYNEESWRPGDGSQLIGTGGNDMTIDEAIAHAREVAEIQRNNDKLNKTLGKSSPYYNTDCIKCAEEHEQLAEWLEELKDYQDKNKMVVRVDVENMDSIKDKIDELSKYAESQYNKAIDDFVAQIENITDQDEPLYNIRWDYIAEQLKAGGENGTDNQ